MEICKMKIGELNAAKYNPRVDLQEDDDAYKKIEKSIDNFGFVEPLIYNKNTKRLVDGHQRLKVLRANGATETDVVIVDLDQRQEKILNVALSKIKGRWDYDKLSDVLVELREEDALDSTGFDAIEVQALLAEYSHINDLLNDDFSIMSKQSNRMPKESFAITFVLPAEYEEQAAKYILENGSKKPLVNMIVEKAEEAAVEAVEKDENC